jgi:hypothetical protein
MWWFGVSFGNRAFIEVLIPLAFSSALILDRLLGNRVERPGVFVPLATITLAFVILNFYLWVGYLLQKYPQDGSHTVAQAYLWLFLR